MTPFATRRKCLSHGRSNTTNANSARSHPREPQRGDVDMIKVRDEAVDERGDARAEEHRCDGSTRESASGPIVDRPVCETAPVDMIRLRSRSNADSR